MRFSKAELSALTRNTKLMVSVTAVFSSLTGAVIGYKVAQKRLREYYEDISTEEIAQAKSFYASLHAIREKPASPEAVLAALHSQEVLEELHNVEATAIMRDYAGNPDVGKSGVKNIFTEAEVVPDLGKGWDYPTELRIREENPGKPYILSQEEYFENEPGHEQTALTYFLGDDTLSDDKDVPVPDADATVGDETLTQFGHGSKDNRVVYVRNERLEMDFEIALSDGKFQVEVLGFDDPDALKHSHRPGIRKFRESDE